MMKSPAPPHLILVMLAALAGGACGSRTEPGDSPFRMVEVLLTSEAGHKLASTDVVPFRPERATGRVITVDPGRAKQQKGPSHTSCRSAAVTRT